MVSVRRSILLLLSITLAVGAPVVTASGGSAAPDRDGTAMQRLQADADGALRVSSTRTGRGGFVGVPAASEVDNPAVTTRTSVLDAAASHVARYGGAVGLDARGSELVDATVTRSVTGHDLVRYQQQVGGVPVLGGDVVVNVRPDRELGSMLATVTGPVSVQPAVVSTAQARAKAREAVARQAPETDVRLLDQGRWVFDPTVFGAPEGLGARTVRRIEATDGAGFRRQVLVDDLSGRVLLDIDLIASIDRVVCDNANVQRLNTVACTSGFARTETSGASGVADVNSAFTLGGQVSTFYNDVGGLDLTQALGINVGGVKKLAQTVRWCYSGVTCPYPNAFWNGQQMFYGAGFAVADDVVGHEMTHGVIDQNSELFYWFQSGAINESLADTMGEIVDHRYGLVAGDSSWTMGEDLSIGAIRSMSNPGTFGDPDRMTSPNYFLDSGYQDNGGVHLNSGVGNKTAYLISQGGSFNGQSIVGIDGADTGLTKTGKLYYAVIQGLTSGSEYADYADVLDQSCQDMIGTGGFTATDCTNVHKVTLATELRTTPTKAPQPADAPTTCPTDTVMRVLFDSETGSPGSKFAHSKAWTRAPGSVQEPGTTSTYAIAPNARSGRASWFGLDASSSKTLPLTASSAIKLPAGQKSYLWFQHWYLMDYVNTTYYDGGTVEVDNVGNAAGFEATESRPWVNGPTRQLVGSSRKAFAGDSLGWVSSRLNLSAYAGKKIKPRFTVRTDSAIGYYGWFLDDIRVYTCDPTFITGKTPKITGKTKVGKKLTAKPGAWTPGGLTFKYQWFRGSKKIKGATAKTYKLKRADKGKKMKVKVTGKRAGYAKVSKTSKPTRKITG